MDVFLNADDFARSSGVTDSILETIDHGVVHGVSILVTGTSYKYALEEWKKREGVHLALHFNITEGLSISSIDELSLLVDQEGRFIHTPFTLARAYYFSGYTKRNQIRNQIRNEFKQQLETLRSDIKAEWTVRVDSHDHIHMLPFVMDEITDELEGYRDVYVRLVREPLYVVKPTGGARGVLRDIVQYFWVMVLGFLSLINARKLTRKSITYPASFVGLFRSGKMNSDVLRSAFSAVGERRGVTEVAVHPGGAVAGEEQIWSPEEGSYKAWYFSPDRENERRELCDDKMRGIVERYQNGLFEPTSVGEKVSVHLGVVLRFVTVGAIAAAVHLSILYLAVELLLVWYVLGTAIGFGFGFVVSFTLQKFWTFNDHRTKELESQISQYFLLQMFGLVINLGGIYVLVEYLGMWYLPAQVLLLAVVAVLVFTISRLIIFNAHPQVRTL